MVRQVSRTAKLSFGVDNEVTEGLVQQRLDFRLWRVAR